MYEADIIFVDPPVYIPHSSDKTYTLYKILSSQNKVYIPHSSDKTRQEINRPVKYCAFTSLIVQIKQIPITEDEPEIVSLHPS